MRVHALIPALLAAACASTPQAPVERVKMVNADQRTAECKSLGTFSVNQRGGPDKPSAAMRKAIDEVTSRGGNGLYVIANTVDWEEGATVNAEALHCTP